MTLLELSRGTDAIVVQVQVQHDRDPIAQRLSDLGFVAGEHVRVVASGPLGNDPLLISLGCSRFALRRSEAQRVLIQEVAS
jgi:ferrous iron transport protein A